jgi:hypothetical protein
MSKTLSTIIGILAMVLVSVAIAALVRAEEAAGEAKAAKAKAEEVQRTADVKYYPAVAGARLEQKVDAVIQAQQQHGKLLEKILERVERRRR